VTADLAEILADIDEVLASYGAMAEAAKHDDCSDLGDVRVTQEITTLAATIERYAPPGSRYANSAETLVTRFGPMHSAALAPLAGILASLRQDMALGRLKTFAELVHADVFSDLLDMAAHLLEENYKDASAVMIGGVLEGHLAKLCEKHGLSREVNGRPKKAEHVNAELAGVSAYSKVDQKNVTAWLGLRNQAAHGQYTQYTADQVKLLLQSVRDFLTRMPA